MSDMPKNAQEFVEKYGRVFSPSGSSKWLFCTGAAALEAEIRRVEPEQRRLPSTYASEGTVAHKLGAMCLERDVSPYVYINEELAAEDETDFTYKVDLEMANAVNIYVEYALALMKPEFDPLIEVEQKLDLTGISPYVHSGTSDCWVFQRNTRHLHVLDYKHGKGVDVSVENNTQLMVYALGITQKLYRAYKIPLNEIDKITLHIIQPRVNNGNTPIKAWDLSPQVLPWFHEFILAAIKSAFSPTPTFAPSESRCRWCMCAARCTARAEQSMKAAQLDFDHLVNFETSKSFGSQMAMSPMGQVFDAVPEPHLPAVHALATGEIASVLRWKKRIEQFLADVSRYALELRLKGDKVPGFKLVRGRSLRRWKDENEVLKTLAQVPIDRNEFFSEPHLLSPAQMEEVLKKHKLDRKILESVIIKPEGDLTIVPVSDKRPEVKPMLSAHHEFAPYKE